MQQQIQSPKSDYHSTQAGYAAGFNRFARIVRRGKAVKVYLAKDADGVFVSKVLSELKGKNIGVNREYTSEELAQKAGIEVATAIVTEFV